MRRLFVDISPPNGVCGEGRIRTTKNQGSFKGVLFNLKVRALVDAVGTAIRANNEHIFIASLENIQ